MSQLLGQLPIDFSDGFTFAATVHVTPTGFPRKKVIWEGGAIPHPRMTIFLDWTDQLAVSVEGVDGRTIQTPAVDPARITGRPALMRVEISPADKDGARQLTLWLDGQQAATARGTCDLGGKLEQGQHAIGAQLDGEYPAALKLYNFAIFDKALSPADARSLDQKLSLGNAREKAGQP